MTTDEKRTAAAYLCPRCGRGVLSAVSLRSLSADMVKLKCACGESELRVVRDRGGSFRVTVPCLICPAPHTFTVSASLFLSDEPLTLSCPYAGIGLCFTGEVNHVKAELARASLEVMKALEAEGASGFPASGDGGDARIDPQIHEIILFTVRDLEAEGRIYCRCPDRMAEREDPDGAHALPKAEGDGGESRYETVATPQGVVVTCRRCGASRVIPADSVIAAHDFLESDSLRLE